MSHGSYLVKVVRDTKGNADTCLYRHWRGTCQEDIEERDLEMCQECEHLLGEPNGCECDRCPWCGFLVANDRLPGVKVSSDPEPWHVTCLLDVASYRDPYRDDGGE